MKKLSVIIVFAIVCSTFFLIQCGENKTGTPNNQKDTVLVGSKSNGGYESPVKWGEHLVRSMGCGDCHSPKKWGRWGLKRIAHYAIRSPGKNATT